MILYIVSGNHQLEKVPEEFYIQEDVSKIHNSI